MKEKEDSSNDTHIKILYPRSLHLVRNNSLHQPGLEHANRPNTS